jgi:thioredoxin domain-containing protein 5
MKSCSSSSRQLQSLKFWFAQYHHCSLNVVLILSLQNTLTIASQALLGTAPLYTATSPALLERFHIPPASAPVLLALKDHDGTVAAQLPLFSGIATPDLQAWMMRHRLPSALELSADTFKSVMEAPHNPLVVLTAVPPSGAARDEAIRKLKEAAKTWRHRANNYQRDVAFAWMDGDRWASWLSSMYGIKAAQMPATVITEHGVRIVVRLKSSP